MNFAQVSKKWRPTTILKANTATIPIPKTGIWHCINFPGDLAQAYVIGHVLVRHVQHHTVILCKVQGMRNHLSEVEFNQMMVRLELQADFYAGVYLHHTQNDLGTMEPCDFEEALNVASAICP
ncbi:MAG: neutral zinc metallopeptidase [Cyclobacteriaceae bacterium]